MSIRAGDNMRHKNNARAMASRVLIKQSFRVVTETNNADR